MERDDRTLPRVSVVVPVRNAERTIVTCVRALAGQDYPRELYEVIVVDDGSTDATAAAAEAAGARVLRIEPSGPAAARNRGAQAATGDLLLFTDADCAPDPSWIRNLVAPFADAGVVAAKGAYRTEQRGWIPRLVQIEYETRYRRMRRLRSIDFIDTYAAAYRRDAFLAAGGFDETFPVPCVEDQELSFRMAGRGGRMVFVPEAVVRHLHAPSLWAYCRKKFKIAYWKMRVLRRYPQKALRDSHTPLGLKLEIPLAYLIAVSPLAAVALQAAWLPALPGVAFLGAAAPFLSYVLRREPALVLPAVLFLFARALSLGLGMARGAAVWSREKTGRGGRLVPEGVKEHA